MSRVAVVIVDLQRDFLDQASSSPVARWEKTYCVPSVHRLVSFARAQGWQVIHVGTKHRSMDSLPHHHRVRGDSLYCLENTPGSEFVVKVEQGDIDLYKTWYSAFDTTLDDHVEAGDTVIWAGVTTDCCIQASAFDADRREINSVIPIQAVSASSCEMFTASLTALAKSVATIVDIDAVLASGNISECAIEIAEVGGRAEEWFKGQEALLSNADSSTSLIDILRRLGVSVLDTD